MTDLSKRIRVLRFLRDIFIISLVVGLGSFLTLIVTLSFGPNHEFSVGGGMTIFVLDTIFGIGHLLIVLLSAATLILALGINRESKVAFFLGLGAVVAAIVAGILQYAADVRIGASIASLVSDLAISCAIFALIDGIYDGKARNTVLFKFLCLGVGLMILSAIISFIAVAVPMAADMPLALLTTSGALTIVADAIVFLILQSAYGEVRHLDESED